MSKINGHLDGHLVVTWTVASWSNGRTGCGRLDIARPIERGDECFGEGALAKALVRVTSRGSAIR